MYSLGEFHQVVSTGSDEDHVSVPSLRSEATHVYVSENLVAMHPLVMSNRTTLSLEYVPTLASVTAVVGAAGAGNSQAIVKHANLSDLIVVPTRGSRAELEGKLSVAGKTGTTVRTLGSAVVNMTRLQQSEETFARLIVDEVFLMPWGGGNCLRGCSVTNKHCDIARRSESSAIFFVCS